MKSYLVENAHFELIRPYQCSHIVRGDFKSCFLKQNCCAFLLCIMSFLYILHSLNQISRIAHLQWIWDLHRNNQFFTFVCMTLDKFTHFYISLFLFFFVLESLLTDFYLFNNMNEISGIVFHKIQKVSKKAAQSKPRISFPNNNIGKKQDCTQTKLLN